MKLTFTNEKTKLKDGKHIAFANIQLEIEGEQYPVRLIVSDKRDNKKINKALKAKGFVIGEVGETEEVEPYKYLLKGE